MYIHAYIQSSFIIISLYFQGCCSCGLWPTAIASVFHGSSPQLLVDPVERYPVSNSKGYEAVTDRAAGPSAASSLDYLGRSKWHPSIQNSANNHVNSSVPSSGSSVTAAVTTAPLGIIRTLNSFLNSDHGPIGILCVVVILIILTPIVSYQLRHS